MPKNYGAGVGFGVARSGGLRSLVRLGRRELWLRLDRNMVGGAVRGEKSGPDAGDQLSGGSVRPF